MLIWNFCNESAFEFKKIQCVRFWNEIFSTYPIWTKSLQWKKNKFWFIFFGENDIFCVFGVFSKSMILIWRFFYVLGFKQKKYNASDFESKILQRARFWIKFFIDWSDLKLKKVQHVRFWIKLWQSVWFWTESFTKCLILYFLKYQILNLKIRDL